MVAALMTLDTDFDQSKTRVAKIMIECHLAGTLQRVVEGDKPTIIVKMIGTQRLVHQFTLKMGKFSQHHDNFGIHLGNVSSHLNEIFQEGQGQSMKIIATTGKSFLHALRLLCCAVKVTSVDFEMNYI
jgi:hypothetical protein